MLKATIRGTKLLSPGANFNSHGRNQIVVKDIARNYLIKSKEMLVTVRLRSKLVFSLRAPAGSKCCT